MRLKDLDSEIQKRGFDPVSFGVGCQKEETLCISDEKYNWAVYHFERGSRSNEKTFNDEEEAVSYFLSLVDGMARRRI